MSRPDQSAGHAVSRAKNHSFINYCHEHTLFYTLCICCSLGVGGWVGGVARVKQVIPCVLTEYINHVDVRSSMFHDVFIFLWPPAAWTSATTHGQNGPVSQQTVPRRLWHE